jgi:RNA polymerase sigma-70 factor (ECF subfamily)
MEEEVQEIFCELYQRYYFFLYKKARYFFSDQELAHDLVQDAFLKVMLALQKGNRELTNRGYLVRLMTNVCIDHLRKRDSKLQVELDETLLSAELIENNTPKLIDRIYLHELFQRLPKSLHEIAVYRLVDGYSLDEIVEILNMPKRTLQRRLKKIFAHLTN